MHNTQAEYSGISVALIVLYQPRKQSSLPITLTDWYHFQESEGPHFPPYIQPTLERE